MRRLQRPPATVWMLTLAILLVACAASSQPAPAQPSTPPLGAPSVTEATPAATPLPMLPSPAVATPSPVTTVVNTTDKAARAGDLVDRLASAPSDQARYEALLAVMQELAIGVYTPGGQAVVSGAERGPNDFYLYDFELRLMAQSLARKDSWLLTDNVDALNAMGLRRGNQPISVDALWASLQTGTRQAVQQPTGRLSLLPLLVRELGMRQAKPYDLLQVSTYSDLSFDALQQFLILADLMLPLVRQVWPIATAPAEQTAGRDGLLTLRPIALQNPCTEMVGQAMREGWIVGIFPLGTTPPANANEVIKQIIKHFHDLMMSIGIQGFNDGPSVGQTHYGHAQPGKPIEFKLRWQMIGDLPDLVVQCGRLQGVHLPKKGPIPDLPLTWAYDELAAHGRVECPAAGCQKTDSGGRAKLVFYPKQEVQPTGFGPEQVAEGSVSAWSDVYLGTKFQSAKGGTLAYKISYHKPPEFDLNFNSTLNVLDAGAVSTVGRSVATLREAIHLMYDAGKQGYFGNGTYLYNTTPGTAGRCYNTWSGSGAKLFQVARGVIEGDLSSGETPSIELYIRVEESVEKWTTNCAKIPPFPPDSFWSIWWRMNPSRELNLSNDPNIRLAVRVTGWEYRGSERLAVVFASKKWTSNCRGNCQEETNLMLTARAPQ